MPGGLIQVIARGTQDAYLSVKPQVTNWKAVYRRHTIFATESIEQVFNGTGDFNKKVVCNIQRNGDLITKMYLRVKLPALDAGQCWCPRVGHAMIKNLELNVGGTAVEKQTGDWLNVVHELYRDFAHDRGYDEMIGNTAALTVVGEGTLETTLYIPLKFFCCNHDGLAIPLIATQYHDTRVEVEFNPISQLVCGPNAASVSGKSMGGCSLFVDYVYLGAVERKKFAQASHEYLIEQVQYAGGESVRSQSQKFRLDFNHPCKAINVNVQQDKYITGEKFMAWNPTDWEQTKSNATKRIAMAWGELASSGLYEAKSGVGTKLTAAINNARVAATDISSGDATPLDMDSLLVLGHLMSDDMISQTITELDVLAGTATRTTTTGSDALAANDVCVYDWTNYGVFLNGKVNPVKELLIQLNGSERLSKRDGLYFNYVQSYQCYKVTPCDGLNSLSFALNPTAHQPSGSCNMSRIDNASIHIDFITQAGVQEAGKSTLVSVSPYVAARCNIYSPNYNVFRVMGGMAGLGFSN
jgi:hypothetical protein